MISLKKIYIRCVFLLFSVFFLNLQMVYSQSGKFSEQTEAKIKSQIEQIEAAKKNLTKQEAKVESYLRDLINTMQTDRKNGTLENKSANIKEANFVSVCCLADCNYSFSYLHLKANNSPIIIKDKGEKIKKNTESQSDGISNYC